MASIGDRNMSGAGRHADGGGTGDRRDPRRLEEEVRSLCRLLGVAGSEETGRIARSMTRDQAAGRLQLGALLFHAPRRDTFEDRLKSPKRKRGNYHESLDLQSRPGYCVVRLGFLGR